MRKRLLIILAMILFAFPAYAQMQGVTIQGGTMGGAAAVFTCPTGHVLDECFDGSQLCIAAGTSNCNVTATAWTGVAGTAFNFALADPLDGGTYSLEIDGTAANQSLKNTTSFAAGTEVWAFLKIKIIAVNGTSIRNFFGLGDGIATERTLYSLVDSANNGNNKLNVSHGSGNATSSSAMADNTEYNIWTYFLTDPGGSNGVGWVCFTTASTNTPPATPSSDTSCAYTAAGTATTTGITRSFLKAHFNVATGIKVEFDCVVVDDSVISTAPCL